MKMVIGAVLVIGAVSTAVVINSMSGTEEETAQETADETEAPQEAADRVEKLSEGEEAESASEEEQSAEPEEKAVSEREKAVSESTEENKELAISGVYDKLGVGKDGIIVVCKGGKWGLVTYDNEVIVPLQYAFACTGPNDDGQTFFGNEGDYRVFDREGQEIFRTEKPIKAVSEGVVLWEEKGEWDYRFGYVKPDGTVMDIYEKREILRQPELF